MTVIRFLRTLPLTSPTWHSNSLLLISSCSRITSFFCCKRPKQTKNIQVNWSKARKDVVCYVSFSDLQWQLPRITPIKVRCCNPVRKWKLVKYMDVNTQEGILETYLRCASHGVFVVKTVSWTGSWRYEESLLRGHLCQVFRRRLRCCWLRLTHCLKVRWKRSSWACFGWRRPRWEGFVHVRISKEQNHEKCLN